jgi:hypothetical protein
LKVVVVFISNFGQISLISSPPPDFVKYHFFIDSISFIYVSLENGFL